MRKMRCQDALGCAGGEGMGEKEEKWTRKLERWGLEERGVGGGGVGGMLSHSLFALSLLSLSLSLVLLSGSLLFVIFSLFPHFCFSRAFPLLGCF